MTVNACIDPGGRLRIVDDPSKRYEQEREERWAEVGPRGEQGQPGPQGPEGPRGPEGAQGAQGERGPEGAQGATGSRGEQGGQGPQGPPGPSGPEGDPGPPGPEVDLEPEEMVPSGAVMFFDLEECPAGWTELTAAHGRVLIGLTPDGEPGVTQGKALQALEDRSHIHDADQSSLSIGEGGSHAHPIVQPMAFRTNEVGNHGHRLALTSMVYSRASGTRVAENLAPNHWHQTGSPTGNHSHEINERILTTSSDSGAHSHEPEAIHMTFEQARTKNVIPYMQLRVCRKD